jgi:hypothetical protein
MLERIDQEHLPCFLDTSSERNVAISQRFGFGVVSVNNIPGTELKSFAMLRKAQMDTGLGL